MRKLIALTVFTLGLTLSASAQSSSGGRTFGGSGAVSNGGSGGGGGGSVGAGGGMGGVGFSTLPEQPRATFESRAFSGSDAEFEPSTFLAFDKAVATGQAILDAQHASLAEAAKANSRTQKAKAKVAVMEDAVGNPVITTRR